MVVAKAQLEKANRIYQMPPELLSFVRSEQKRGLLQRSDLIDLASFVWPDGDSSLPSVEPDSLRPASREKLRGLAEELATWAHAHYGCKLSPDKEVFIGPSITGLLFSLSLSFLDHGDLAFVPSLGAPIYRRCVAGAGGESVGYDISVKTNWKPDFERMTTRLARVARIVFINSPHNPTGAELTEPELSHLVFNAARDNLLVVNDAAYQSIGDRSPISLMSVTSAKRVGVEVGSFAYQFGLPPMPFGFVLGNKEAISALRQTSRLIPTPIPTYFVDLAIDAIRRFPSAPLREARQQFKRTADCAGRLIELLSLEEAGLRTVPYIWAKIPSRRNSSTLVRQLYRRHRVLIAPGTDFGDTGYGYLRLSLTAGEKAYTEAASRVKKRVTLGKKKP